MWRSGVTRRRRHTVLAEMIETAARTGDFDAPWRSTPEVFAFFHDEAEILRDLQQEWRTILAGAVYVAIDAGHGDLEADVLAAFLSVQRRHAGLRRILETHAAHPAIAAAMRKEQALLSRFVGAPGTASAA